MPTTSVPAYRCGTDRTGWLDGDFGFEQNFDAADRFTIMV